MSAPFRLYNTLTRRVDPFEPLRPGHISLYVCGNTVYDNAHVGHARAMVVFDTFARWLRHVGWDVRFVRNFTDVDDKIIRRAAEQGIEPAALAQRYIDAYQEDSAALGLEPPTVEPRVSTSIDEIVAMIARLIERGHAYEAGGSVWFSVSTFPAYGQLSGQDPDDMMSSPDDGVKQDPRDFALWKAAKPGEPSWPSPWGDGRPGWHIECSAMCGAHLGATIDIHGGGLDLVFPHHENEIAQSTCAHGQTPVRWWMHNGLLNMGAAKMGKSLGNVVDIRDALHDFPAETLRLYYLQNHYRSPLPWSDEALPEALAMLARLYEAREVAEGMAGSEDADTVAADLGDDARLVLELGRGFRARFLETMADDFNTSAALGHAFELARAINRFANHKKAAKRGAPVVAPALDGLKELASIGLLTLSTHAFQEELKVKRLRAMGVDRAEVEQLLQSRLDARAAKDWAAADAIRDRLDALGIVVMDRAEGVDWKIRITAG